MIQRKQTIWLLLVIVLMIISAFVPFAHKSIIDVFGVAKLQSINTRDISYISLCVADTIVMALFAIFLFKNRKLQKIFCLLGVAALIGLLILEVVFGNNSAENTALTFGLGLPIIALLLFIKAYADINADDKLVKSVDRLRD
jgi:peptidoglycan/LPS O-acetylase OafA/YrhL